MIAPGKLISDFLARWSAAGCSTRAAALAFYTVFSLAPVLVIVIAVGSLVVDEVTLSTALVGEMERLMGRDGAALVAAMLESAEEAPRGAYALVALVLLLFGATTAFAELKESLDAVFRTDRAPAGTLWQMLRGRLLSFGLVLTLAFLLLVALVANTAMRAGTGMAAAAFGWDNALLLHIASEALSVLGAFVLFAAIYRLLPQHRMPWRNWLAASAFTTALFTLGRIAIGVYLGHSDASLAFGPAASLAIVMLWVYYAAMIFLAGAVIAAILEAGPLRARQPEPSAPPGATLAR